MLWSRSPFSLWLFLHTLNIMQNSYKTEAAAFFRDRAGTVKFRARLPAGTKHTLKAVRFQPRITVLGFCFLQERRGEMMCLVSTTMRDVLAVENEFKPPLGLMALNELLVLFTIC